MELERRLAGRYHLLEPIGRGGMGVVWRAHDDLLDRTVAVKEVLYHPTSAEDRETFNRRTIREARAAGRIDHPNVVVVHDVIEEDGRPWIVMQLVRARSLGRLLREEGPLPPERVAAIGLQVLDALRTAHAAGVLHRDVKPENVLLSGENRVVLTDFGIATMPEEPGLTVTGGLTGTPAFLPPERLNGEPATPESDLWSLGATLYAAVEGRTPFERNTPVATLAAILHDEPAPPRRAGALTPVLEGLLRKDPARRMGAAEAAALLAAAVTPGHAAAPDAVTGAPGPAGSPGTGTAGHPTRVDGHGLRTAGPESSVGAYPGARPARRGSAARVTLLVLLPLLLVAAVVGGWYGFSSLAGDGAVAEESTPPPGPGRSASGEPHTSPPSERSPRPSTPPAATLPRGWRIHRDPLGFSIALPPGWVPSREATRVRFHDPDTPDYLQVDLTPWYDPDPVTALRTVERNSTGQGRLPGYERIGVTTGRYRGVPSADWEFTFTPSSGKVRVLDRAFKLGDGRTIMLYWQVADTRWTSRLSWWRVFTSTFRPEAG
ncbi:MAG: protein kinase [Microbispora sp.]|nr:protein kinase [Microbispora sp.]